jgi:hypothetical protein
MFLMTMADSTTLAQSPSIVANYSAYYPGEDIVVSFKEGPGNRKDWAGIYPDGVEPGPTPSTRWLYVDGTQNGNSGLKEGILTFVGGVNDVGVWNVFFLLNDGYTKMATNQFTVVDPSLPLVRANKRAYSPGETIAIALTNGPANPKDWIGIYLEGQAPGGPQATLWNYTDGTRNGTLGANDGTLVFNEGLSTPGNYRAYFLENDGYTIFASDIFSIAPPFSQTPRLLSLQPANNATNLPPVVAFEFAITNGATQVVSNSVRLSVDSVPVAAQIAPLNNQVRITYTNDLLFAPASSHTATLVFADNGSPANAFTQSIAFTIAPYRNIVLPQPLYFENFDSTEEGKLPAGWTGISYTDIQNADIDFGNLDSAAYAQWTVVNADRFKGAFVTYSNPDSPKADQEDYQKVLSINPLNVVNGKVLNEPLAKGRFLFSDSGYRNGLSQVMFISTPDFDLTGKKDVNMSYHSLWTQNQDSIGAVEYSTDQGTNWMPVVYMLERSNVLKTTNETTGEITFDAVATFMTEHNDAAHYIDDNGEDKGGFYGAFIAAPIGQSLAPFISPRVDDDPIESKRVELFRLPAADNQAKVRFRFAHAGTDSWYFGIDDFGLYSIPEVGPSLALVKTSSGVTLTWPLETSGFILESSANLAAGTWTAVPGVSNNSVQISASGAAMFYRLRK